MLILRWALVLVWLVAIGYFSNQPFAHQDLRPEIAQREQLVEKVRELPPVQFSYGELAVDSRRAPVDFVQFWLRKGGHVVLYGGLGLLVAAALGASGWRSWRRWVAAGAVVFLVAVLDEWHQNSVPGRTGQLVDVLVDFLSFVVFAVMAGLGIRFWRVLVRRCE